MSKPKFIITVIILIIFSSIAFAGLAIDLLLDEGLEQYNKGEKKEALNLFKKILVLEPENTLALKYIDIIEGNTNYQTEEAEPTQGVRNDIMLEAFTDLEKDFSIENELDIQEEKFQPDIEEIATEE